MSEIEIELGRYQTESGRTKTNGPLDVAEKDLARLKGIENDLSNRTNLLDRQFSDLTTARTKQSRLTDSTDIATGAVQLAEAEAQLKKGQASAAIVRTLESEERIAHAKLETALQRLHQFEEIKTRIDLARTQERILVANVADLIEREQTAQEAVEKTKERQRALI